MECELGHEEPGPGAPVRVDRDEHARAFEPGSERAGARGRGFGDRERGAKAQRRLAASVEEVGVNEVNARLGVGAPDQAFTPPAARHAPAQRVAIEDARGRRRTRAGASWHRGCHALGPEAPARGRDDFEIEIGVAIPLERENRRRGLGRGVAGAAIAHHARAHANCQIAGRPSDPLLVEGHEAQGVRPRRNSLAEVTADLPRQLTARRRIGAAHGHHPVAAAQIGKAERERAGLGRRAAGEALAALARKDEAARRLDQRHARARGGSAGLFDRRRTGKPARQVLPARDL